MTAYAAPDVIPSKARDLLFALSAVYVAAAFRLASV
jgi:hypothetical protein